MVALFSTEGVAFAFSSFCGLDSNSPMRPDTIGNKNDLPHIAKSSRKICGDRPTEKLDWFESRHCFDVVLSMMLLLAGWLVGVRRPSRKIVSVPQFANVILNDIFILSFRQKREKTYVLKIV